MERIVKYPRTPHLSGSKLQEGDEDLAQIPFSRIAGKLLVVEEKVDGANAAISFSEDGKLLLQSRGHFLLKQRLHLAHIRLCVLVETIVAAA